MRSRPLVVAHRGASRYAPDNSVEAVQLALSQGADMIEMDVRCTDDGILVAHHDPTVSGVPLRTMTLDRLRVAVPHIATIDELLAVTAGRAMVDLDIKMAGLEEAVLASLRRRPSVEALLTSFSPRVVRRLRDLNSALETGWIVGTRQPRNWLQRLESTGARWFVVEWACLNVQLATECRTRGIPLAVWTVNGRSEIGAAVRTPGVAAVITDVPDVAGDVRDLSLREPVSGSLPDYA